MYIVFLCGQDGLLGGEVDRFDIFREHTVVKGEGFCRGWVEIFREFDI